MVGQTSLQPERFEVDVMLVEAATGRSVWAEAFERSLEPVEIIALRNEVANRVARSLAQPYGAIQSDQTRDADGKAPEMLGSCVPTRRGVVLRSTTHPRSSAPAAPA